MPLVVRLPKPIPKPAANPQADPRFRRVSDGLKRGATNLKKHPPAAKKAAEAQKAAKPPANEKLAGAKANQVDTMKAAKAEKPQPNAFLELLRAEIKKVMPQNLDEADSFMEEGKKEELQSSVSGKVGEQKDEATGDIKAASNQAPNTSKVPGKEVTPMPADPASPTPVVKGGEAMPAPKSDADISQQQNKADADQMMKDAEISEPQMKKANDPRFSAVLTAKSNVAKVADTSPGKYRAAEKLALGQAAAQADTQSRQGVALLLGVKGKSNANVKSRQQAAKEKDEQRRKQVAETIEGIYNQTKQKVDNKLSSLESEVLSVFDSGINTNLADLKNNTKQEVEDYKDERYSGIRGKARWIRDQFRPLVPGVKEIIQRNLAVFTKRMDALIVRVANLVEKRLQEAKAEIDRGQAQIKSYVASLPKDLQAVGKAAEKEVSSRFDEMRRGVDDKQNDLAQKLAAKYKQAQDSANAIAKKIEDENKGAVYKLAEAIGEIIKILAEFKDKLMAALRKGWAVIKHIIADPIEFLGNLLAAIKQGFSQFRERFVEHLEKGFIKWLFGALAGSGIELPKDLSLPSILKLVMQVLGLTYERLRAKAVKLIGERNVAILEKVFDYVKTLITEGPAALWEKIKADLSNLKDMVIGAIQQWILTQIIKSAITKLVTMFNPVGAIIQALITIYNTVMFVIENAKRLLEFVEAVVNSVAEIASGAIGKAANWIETALANMIPMVIGFLARLIGLGGIADAVVGIIKKVQGVVDRAIDKVIEKIVATVKKLAASGKAAIAGLVEWWKSKLSFTDKKGRPHKLFYSGEEDGAELMVASTQMLTDRFFAKVEAVMQKDPIARSLGTMPLSECKKLKIKLDDEKKGIQKAKRKKDANLQQKHEQAHKEIMTSTTMQINLPILMDLLPENQTDKLPVKPGQFVTIPYKKTERKGEILVVSTINVRYKIDAISGVFYMPSAEFQTKWGKEIFEYVEGSLRDRYLGATPGKASKTGKDVIARYKIRTVGGVVEVEWKPNTWHPLLDCDMSHWPKDAVDWWNNVGRHTGPKSSDVRKWMLDPKNYILEPASINRSRGSANNSRYMPPTA